MANLNGRDGRIGQGRVFGSVVKGSARVAVRASLVLAASALLMAGACDGAPAPGSDGVQVATSALGTSGWNLRGTCRWSAFAARSGVLLMSQHPTCAGMGQVFWMSATVPLTPAGQILPYPVDLEISNNGHFWALSGNEQDLLSYNGSAWTVWAHLPSFGIACADQLAIPDISGRELEEIVVHGCDNRVYAYSSNVGWILRASNVLSVSRGPMREYAPTVQNMNGFFTLNTSMGATFYDNTGMVFNWPTNLSTIHKGSQGGFYLYNGADSTFSQMYWYNGAFTSILANSTTDQFPTDTMLEYPGLAVTDPATGVRVKMGNGPVLVGTIGNAMWIWTDQGRLYSLDLPSS